MNHLGVYTKKQVDSFAGNVAETKMSLPELAVIIFLACYYLLPSFSVGINFVVPLFVVLLYMACISNNEPKTAKAFALLVFCSIVISVLYLVLTNTSSISATASNLALKRLLSKFNQNIMFFSPVFISERIIKKATHKQKKYITLFFCFIFAYVIINTTIELFNNEAATRAWANFEEQNENDVGTYAYIYAVPIVTTAFVSLVFKTKITLYKTLLIIATVALIVFLVMAQYTLALIIAIIGIVLQVNKNLEKQTTKIMLWMVMIFMTLFLSRIINFFASIIPLQQVSERLYEIADFFESGDATGYNLNGRLTLYWKTIVAFFKSPIVGNQSLGFDGHATLLTIPADIGIFGAAAYYVILKNARAHVRDFLDKSDKQFISAFICLVCMGFTNPIHSALPLAFASWVVVPMIIYTIGEKDETKLGNRRTRFNNLLRKK